MKNKFKSLCEKHSFLIFAVLALLLPDFLLRNPLDSGIWLSGGIFVTSTLFSLCYSAILLFVCLALLPQKAGQIVYGIVNSAFIILSLCQYVYSKIFGQFFWVKSIALAGEGAEYFDTALTYIDLKLVIFTAIAVFFMVLAIKRWKKPQLPVKKSVWRIATPILGLVALHIFMLPQTFGTPENTWDAWAHPRVIYKKLNNSNKAMATNGLYQMTIRDTYRTLKPNRKKAEDFSRAEDYFAAKEGLSTNEYTGIFEGKNVIAVMMESIDTWLIDEKYTPTISYMMKNGIDFTDFYAPTFGTGHTFNTEFAFNTGFFSPLSASNATNFTGNKFPLAIANLFAEKGYTTNSFHFNSPEYYNRGVMHKNFGYEAYNAFSQMGMGMEESKLDSNVMKNDEIYQKMIEKQPFFDFVITMSAHLPYNEADNSKIKQVKKNYSDLVDENMDEEKSNILLLAKDTDEFFRQLLTKLEADGLLDNTVIVSFTDHYAYGISDPQKLEEYKGGDLLRRVPAFIFAKGLEGKKVSKPAQTIDLLPTLLNLFGIETDQKFMGNDILSPDNSGFVYFENGVWKTGEMYYDPSEANPDLKQREYIEEQNARVQEYFDITEIVVTGDYFAGRTKAQK